MSTRSIWLTSVFLVGLLTCGLWLFSLSAAEGQPTHLSAPVTGHPRLWLRAEDLPRLRSWAVGSNPLYNALAGLAVEAKADMDAGLVPGEPCVPEVPEDEWGDCGSTAWVPYPTEMYAQLFAFMSLIENEPAVRDDYAQRARTLLMHVMNEAAKGPAEGERWRDPDFSTDDRARWWGEAWALTVDWVYPDLTAADKATIRQVFLRWAEEMKTTGYHHPEPIGVINDPILISDTLRVRWAGNNYYTAHMRNIGLMAMALDEADDPDNELRDYLSNATGAWLYVVDHLLRTDARGGLGPEGFEYSPQTIGYIAGDFMEMFGPLGLYDDYTGNASRLEAGRWIQTHLPPGGADALIEERVRDANTFRDAILYFMLFDPGAPAPANPRPAQPLNFYVPGIGYIFARTSWDTDATWFTYKLGWNSIDHQHADGNQFEFYRQGEWLTKERTGYGFDIGSSDYHNTLALENDRPDRDPDDYRITLWERGSQWLYEPSADGQILAHSFGRGFAYTLGDTTGLYNSDYEGVTDITHASRSIVWLKPDHIIVYDRATSKTAGRFKRFWLNLPVQAEVSGLRATMTMTSGQQLFVTTLLPTDAVVTSEPADPQANEEAANQEPMQYRLRVEAPDDPQTVRFLHALQGADAGASADPVTLIESTDGTPFAGTLVDSTVVLFPVDLDTSFNSLTYTVPAGTETHLITGLTPNGSYEVATQTMGDDVQVTIRTGDTYQADDGGVLIWPQTAAACPDFNNNDVVDTEDIQTIAALWRTTTTDPRYDRDSDGGVTIHDVMLVAARWGESCSSPAPTATSTPTPTATGTIGPTSTSTPTNTSPATSTPTATPTSTPTATPTDASGTSGHITYELPDESGGHVYRIEARAGATPEDISEALNTLAAGAVDDSLNISPNGQWLALITDRFAPECVGWECLSIVAADLSTAEVVRANGELVRPDGLSAVASGGNLIVYPGDPAEDSSRQRDLWAVARSRNSWEAPLLLTGDSPYAWNDQPAISADGTKVVFDCGDEPYGAKGTAICEVSTDGSDFRVVIMPAQGPGGSAQNALHHPDYAPDGGVVFEADWQSEQIWRLPAGSTEPIRINAEHSNDNSPCVLPDGRIVSLWPGRPGGAGHELKAMAPDGSSHIMVLAGVDVFDTGIGCGE